MRRMTKMLAAMLVLAFATIAVPPTAEGSLFESLIHLTDPGWTTPNEFMFKNYADRDINLRIHAYRPYYDDFVLIGDLTVPPGGVRWTINDYAVLRVKLRIWNKNTKKWVLKDTLSVPNSRSAHSFVAGSPLAWKTFI